MKILPVQKVAFLKNLEKGVYVDNPKNRKMGRVGMTYGGSKEKEKQEKENLNYSFQKCKEVIGKTEILKNTSESQLDAIISYANSTDEGEKIDTKEVLSAKGKKVAIAHFYWDAAEGDTIEEKANNLDAIVEDALANYTPNKEGDTKKLLDKSILPELKPKQLDAIIAYSNSDGAEGIKVDSDAPARKKAKAIAEFYAEAAEGDVENFNSIIEDALEDYVPAKESNHWEEKVKDLNIPLNITGKDFNYFETNWGHYDDGKVSFTYAGYKDPKTGKLDFDLDNVNGLSSKEEIDKLYQALNEKFKKDNK